MSTPLPSSGITIRMPAKDGRDVPDETAAQADWHQLFNNQSHEIRR